MSSHSIFWDGTNGYVKVGNTQINLAVAPPVVSGCIFLSYSDGVGSAAFDANGAFPLSSSSCAEIEKYLSSFADFDTAPPANCYGVAADGSYLGLVAHDQAHSVMSAPMPGGNWILTKKGWQSVLTVAEAQSIAAAEIDNAAGSARMRYITDVPGQAATYIAKLDQAREYIANGGTPGAFITGEAQATGVDLMTAAKNIAALGGQWEDVLAPAIEQYRRVGKLAVFASQTLTDVQTAQATAVNALSKV